MCWIFIFGLFKQNSEARYNIPEPLSVSLLSKHKIALDIYWTIIRVKILYILTKKNCSMGSCFSQMGSLSFLAQIQPQPLFFTLQCHTYFIWGYVPVWWMRVGIDSLLSSAFSTDLKCAQAQLWQV